MSTMSTQAEAEAEAESKTHTHPDGVGGGVEVSIPLVALDTALGASDELMTTPDLIRLWWHNREARGWVTTTGMPIRKWQSDLIVFAQACRANQADRDKRAGPAKQQSALEGFTK